MTTDQAASSTLLNDPVKHTIEKFFNEGNTYGSVIGNDWFMGSFGLQEPKSIAEADQRRMLFALYMGAFRARMLAEHKMAIRTKPGVGQEVVFPEDQTRWAMCEAQSTIAQIISKTRDRLTCIDSSKLSDAGRQENIDALNRLSFLDRDAQLALP